MREIDTKYTNFAHMRTPTVKKRYSNSEIAFALEQLKKNDYNYYRTSRELHISRASLSRWLEEFKIQPLVVEEEDIPVVDEAVEISHINNDLTSLDEAITLAINKAKELIPLCKNAIAASTVAKNLTKVRLDLTGRDLDEEKKSKTYNIIQATIDIFNQNK